MNHDQQGPQRSLVRSGLLMRRVQPSPSRPAWRIVAAGSAGCRRWLWHRSVSTLPCSTIRARLSSAYQPSSISEFAVRVGVSDSTVRRALIRHGIARLPRNRNRRPPNAQVLGDPDWLRRRYETRSGVEIAAELGVSARTVYAAMERHQISLRTEPGTLKLRRTQLADEDWLHDAVERGSSRTVAVELAVSPGTVMAAYERAGIDPARTPRLYARGHARDRPSPRSACTSTRCRSCRYRICKTRSDGSGRLHRLLPSTGSVRRRFESNCTGMDWPHRSVVAIGDSARTNSRQRRKTDRLAETATVRRNGGGSGDGDSIGSHGTHPDRPGLRVTPRGPLRQSPWSRFAARVRQRPRR